MSIENAVYAYLSGQTALTSTLASDPSGTNIWQDKARQGAAFPRVVFTVTGGEPTVSNAGPATLSRAEIDIECQALSANSAGVVRDALRPLVNAKQMTWGGVTIQRCFITSEHDSPYPSVHDEETGVIAKVISIEVDYTG